mmetsp:Transcript_34511/g.75364  ORF Transcript_34511/g.75364 Transcript_34511/m.75364 type:complete len:200 (-) Transcript_34511:193-792(-)
MTGIFPFRRRTSGSMSRSRCEAWSNTSLKATESPFTFLTSTSTSGFAPGSRGTAKARILMEQNCVQQDRSSKMSAFRASFCGRTFVIEVWALPSNHLCMQLSASAGEEDRRSSEVNEETSQSSSSLGSTASEKATVGSVSCSTIFLSHPVAPPPKSPYFRASPYPYSSKLPILPPYPKSSLGTGPGPSRTLRVTSSSMR